MLKCFQRPALRASFALVALLGFAQGCGGGGDGEGGTGVPTPVPSSITLSTSAVTINVIDGTSTASAVVRDASGATIPGASVSWSSDTPDVASVAASGASATITARNRGVALITVRSGTVTSSVTVLVRTAFAVTVSPPDGAIRVGNSLPLLATVSADDGAARSVTWTSSAPTIASVTSQGVVTGIAAGTATISARSTSDPRVTASATITVAPPRSIVVTPSEKNVGRNESIALTAQVFVDPGMSSAITWRTNRPLIATVTQQGVVTGVTDGDATITAVSVADTTLRASALVRVLNVVRSISLAPTSATLQVGQTREFAATIVADQGVSRALAWTSSNPAVATVNAQGVATAVGVGNAVVRARAVADSTREGTATISVVARPVELTLATRSVGLIIGGSTTIATTVTGDPGISTAVRWSSRNSAVATVNDQGAVSAVSSGNTYLVAEAVADITKRDSVRVNVVPRLANAWTSSRLGGPLIEDIVSIWAPSGSLAYAVNSLGDVFRWNGSAWAISARGAQFNTLFSAVHGATENAITAVGSNGVIVRFDGTNWTAMTSGTTAALTNVWMQSADTAWAVGAAGTALRFVNGAWTQSATNTTARLRAVSAAGNSVFAVGDGGTIRRWLSGSWQPIESGTSEVLHDVWVSADGGSNIIVVGDFGTILRWNGSVFRSEASSTSGSLFSITGNAAGVLFATGDGVALRFTNGVWVDQSVPYRTRFGSNWIDESSRLWVGGQRGLLMTTTAPNVWSTLSLTPDLLDVWSSSATHAITVGELGFIFHYNGAEWTRRVAPTLERLNTVWAASSTLAFAAGDNGVLIRWNGTAWTEQDSPTSDHIYAMWGASPNAVWAVSDGGEILFWNGTAWTVALAQSEPLYGIHGDSEQSVYAVGLSGTVLYWNGNTWNRRDAGTNNVLVGVWGEDATHAVAVGARDFSSGVTLRYNGTWSEVSVGTSRILSAVWGVVPFDLYAVGDLGAIVRYNGTSWSTMTSGTTEFLWAVTGAPDASGAGFAVGLNGVMLQAQPSASASVSNTRAGVLRNARQNLAPARGATRTSRGALPAAAARKRGMRQR